MHASSDRFVHGNAIGSSRNNQRTGGGSYLHLQTRGDICLPRSTRDRVPIFSFVREPDQHLGRNGAKLMHKRKLERADE